jgi:hypothetical protein
MNLKFKATIQIRDGNPYVLVTKSQAHQLQPDWKKPMPVIIQVNDKPDTPWKINMMPVGNGDFYLYLHGDVRDASKTKVGDFVEVKIQFDDDYQSGPQHPMPKWFKAALKESAIARQNWDALIPSRKKEILRYFSWLKSDDAIQRNLDKAMYVLEGNKGRFMARDWVDGR